jgi:hypothetical protein
METAAIGSISPIYFYAVYAVGFIAAVTIGSIAWYNSKRPAGWEDKQRPNVIPKINTEENNNSN